GHALCDGKFDLRRFMEAARGDLDRTSARLALVEGDAAEAAIEATAGTEALGGSRAAPAFAAALVASAGPALAGAPAYLRETALFPTMAGLAFVMQLRQTQPWSAVDGVWHRPPSSTEQVLHPAKYASHDEPIAIDARPIATLLTGRRIAHADTLGEL